jgi:hypothetical protein
MKKISFSFDIDDTLCHKGNFIDGDYHLCVPYEDRIALVNKLYDEGHTIYCFTARGMGRTNNDQKLSHELFYQLTFDQLTSWGLKFHKLFLGKPAAQFYIDDKGVDVLAKPFNEIIDELLLKSSGYVEDKHGFGDIKE